MKIFNCIFIEELPNASDCAKGAILNYRKFNKIEKN